MTKNKKIVQIVSTKWGDFLLLDSSGSIFYGKYEPESDGVSKEKLSLRKLKISL